MTLVAFQLADLLHLATLVKFLIDSLAVHSVQLYVAYRYFLADLLDGGTFQGALDWCLCSKGGSCSMGNSLFRSVTAANSS
jgi:hypothetical protein